LGLLFGFQRPSRLSCLHGLCYSPAFSAPVPLQPRGRFFYFNLGSLSTSTSLPFPASSSLKNPPSGFVLPFRGGARLLPRRRSPCQPVSVFCSTTVYRHLISGRFSVQRRTASLLPSVGGAASTSAPHPPSTATGDYSICQSPRDISGPELLSRSRGRGFYHRRVGCQPTSSTSVFPLPAPGFGEGGRITTASAPSRQILLDQVPSVAMLSTASMGENPRGT